MDAETGAILALQILALCSIVAALLAYLMRQSRNATDEYETRNKRHVLVTSCDTCVGLQIAIALYEVGYKVFVGLTDPGGNSPSMKILRAIEQQKEKEEPGDTVHNPQDPEVRARGQIVPLELDPTREDSLRACLDAVRAKLPAGEDGKQLSISCASNGRIVLLGDSTTSYGTKAGTGLVAYSASRKAVEGAAEALKSELQSSGVDVVLLKPPPVNPLILYSSPVLKTSDVESGIVSSEGTWIAPMSTHAIQNSLIPALTTPCPRNSYDMADKTRIFCR
ncbi:uncharacterized protein LOC100883461 isoform X3 [Megachile rotundata]|uniref:uncharacterized protein LOC100883461 isoform X3 n=1 Tax=Megachile rotundata TaxID=143995 RepID=UPI003FD04378